MPAERFSTRLAQRIARFSPLCIGIDPSAQSLKQCGLPDNAEGALAFAERILQAADFELAIVKPQSAYFERYGSMGMQAMEELARLVRAREVLFLLDAKRGDIDTTGLAYAEAYFSDKSSLRADALTLHAYLGFAALEPAIDFAVKQGGGLFPVVRSSNPEGESLQNARLPDDRTVAEALCDAINALNNRYDPEALGPVGAVVGATCEDAEAITQRLAQSFVLAPGVGAQGATMQDVRNRMPSARGRVLPSVSRAILKNGPKTDDIRVAIRALREDAQKHLG
ncbi:MAG TPA: orotidine-5'-phosphate decarboxylase [Burkholderiales bacterium]|nr:orotidine-5'-phosphate decarboxylase [Burkholderiales bacterium]